MIIFVKNSDSIQKKLDTYRDHLLNASLTTIFISSGIYNEKIQLCGQHIKLIGLGDVKITFSSHATEIGKNQLPIGTFKTATFLCIGQYIEFENITFENNAGFGKKIGQAIAFYGHGDQIRFHSCSFSGWQDTLLLGPLPDKDLKGHSMNTPLESMPIYKSYRYTFNDCAISGNVDFIFGSGSGLFINCSLLTLPNECGNNYVSAPSTEKNTPVGFLFLHCHFKSINSYAQCKTYIARPWRPYGKTFLFNCLLDDHVNPQGWSQWNKQAFLADFREYHSMPHSNQRCLIKINENTTKIDSLINCLSYWMK